MTLPFQGPFKPVPQHQLDPAQHPQIDPGLIDQSIHANVDGQGQITSPAALSASAPNINGMGNQPFVHTPGMPAMQIPPGMIGPPDVQTATQGLTPQAAQELQDQVDREDQKNQDDQKKALKAIYGDEFPLILNHPPGDSDWSRWVEQRWLLHQPGIQHNIWMSERNRQFRAGFQWQSRINSMGAWRETPIPRDSVKIVDNRIRPALAWAMQVVSEQRPGWQFKPTNTDEDRERKAEAQQRAVEYQYDAQKKRLIDRESVYWAQTDGVSFQMTYWDPDLGPWQELETGKGPVPLGEPNTRVFRLEHVRVSSEATGAVPPMYWLVRDILPLQYAVSLYGPDVADAQDQALLAQQSSQFSSTNQYAWAPLFQNQQTTARYFVFCEKSDWLPQGLTAIIVGKKLVYGPKPLLMGRVPMIRITDGSEDPAFYPVPKMNLIVGPQMRINMLWSKWYESIRKNSGGRYASKTNAVASETFIGGETSILEVRTAGPIQDAILPVQGFSVGQDIKEALQLEIKQIEDLTGYSDKARGEFESDQSGRAILAEREALERVYGPQVNALAEGNVEWAKQMVGWMRFGYQMPRMLAISGKNRSDLAMSIQSTDLDGITDPTVDPTTMIPQPYALRQWQLDQAFDRKLLTADQYLERSPFADIRDMQSPSQIQYQKAKRITEQLRLRQQPEPMVWQDNESIQQSVLEKDLIMAGGVDPDIQQAAQQRWQQLAQQAAQKQGPPPPAPGSPEANYQAFITQAMNDVKTATDALIAKTVETALMQGVPLNGQASFGPPTPGAPPRPIPAGLPGAPSKPVEGKPMDPRLAPLMGANPSVAAPPSAAAQGGPGVSNQERAAAQFDQQTRI